MKLVIQIPCLNEAGTLLATLAELPREVDGFDEVEWLVVDDGSTDGTAEVARAGGVHHVRRHARNRGLAAAFQTGLDAALSLGADVIVNTDGDNQYPGQAIPELVAPILRGEADMVIGDRQTDTIRHFSRLKRFLQRLGSSTVRWVSGTDVPDAPSGFRALSRDAAFRLHVHTAYTYTLDTIIQAGKKNLTLVAVPVVTNAAVRRSRLYGSVAGYVGRSAITIMQLYLLYEPLKTFAYLSLPPFLLGGVLWVRYLWLVFSGVAGPGTNVQSVIVGGTAILLGVLILSLGVLANLVAANRRLQEEELTYLKRIAYGGNTGREAGDAP